MRWFTSLSTQLHDWWHGRNRRFLLRGLANVTMQALLVATGQNLKRFVAAMTRGQRPAGEPPAAARCPLFCPR